MKIESTPGHGTSVRLTVPQQAADLSPCLSINHEASKDILFYVNPGKYDVAEVREFYRNLAVNMATGLGCPLYAAAG